MPTFNSQNEYQPSSKFRNSLKASLSRYFSLSSDEFLQYSYKKIIRTLRKIQVQHDGFDHQAFGATNDAPALRRKQREAWQATHAITRINQKLGKLNRDTSLPTNACIRNMDDGPWTMCEKTAKDIWRIWLDERNNSPRAGTILLSFDRNGQASVLLTYYLKNDTRQYGFAKGKFDLGETVHKCAARETAEELGLDCKIIYELIEHETPIKKDVPNVKNKSFFEHYYFVVCVNSEELKINLNLGEIDGVDWRPIQKLPCSINCKAINSVPSSESAQKGNYFMVMCSSGSGTKSLVNDIVEHVDAMNGVTAASNSYKAAHQRCPQ